MNINRTGKKIAAVGMSGGVDSTMAALLLQRQGYAVVGLTMKIWDGSVQRAATKSGCYGPGQAYSIAGAQATAVQLGIEHHVIDLSDEFRETVVEYFRREYTNGKTPNPCVTCNSMIKFGALLEKAAKSGIAFDLFATGHYARIAHDPVERRYLLKRGIDKAKDQSYFLYRLSQRQLERTIFPLGDYRKDEIMAIAREAGFEEHLEKPESQDFLEWDDYGVLLGGKGRPGNIVDEEGNVIGKHIGVGRYTVGQRKLLNLAGMKEPFYVLRVDAGRNEITAGPKGSLRRTGLVAGGLHWILPFSALRGERLQAQIRYRSMPAECTLDPEGDGTVRVEFVKPQEAIAPGQSIVFYSGDTVAGGGTIQKSLNDKKIDPIGERQAQ
ncbi:MAG TPA: tRNA 2-thiouridine(34) synthase MnmA [Syntrophorhabdaceae bacterium]|nr:tRNA 2-thiouridine(34) synthase MnmA [Syntrophorhabdaceae bacterium]